MPGQRRVTAWNRGVGEGLHLGLERRRGERAGRKGRIGSGCRRGASVRRPDRRCSAAQRALLDLVDLMSVAVMATVMAVAVAVLVAGGLVMTRWPSVSRRNSAHRQDAHRRRGEQTYWRSPHGGNSLPSALGGLGDGTPAGEICATFASGP